jgi:hypothetical protein
MLPILSGLVGLVGSITALVAVLHQRNEPPKEKPAVTFETGTMSTVKYENQTVAVGV